MLRPFCQIGNSYHGVGLPLLKVKTEQRKHRPDSPLLNDNKITGAKNVLLLIVSGSNEITLDEIGEINIIFKLKQVTMPILLWVLVKMKLWGFNCRNYNCKWI
jgi:hypothetical protein